MNRDLLVGPFIHRNVSIGLPFSRNDGEMKAGIREIVNRFYITTPNRGNTGVYLVVGLTTDVQDIEIYIDRDDAPFQRDDRRASLYRGSLEQGTYCFYWDLHDPDGDPVDPSSDPRYVARLKVEETSGYQRVLSLTPTGTVEDDELEITFPITGKSPVDVPLERFSVGLRQRVVCLTYNLSLIHI